MEVFWVQLAKPFVLMVMLLIAWPFKRAIQLYMKDGKLKRLLLSRIDGSDKKLTSNSEICEITSKQARPGAFEKAGRIAGRLYKRVLVTLVQKKAARNRA